MISDSEKLELYARLETKKGRRHQIGVAIEEMAELTKELSKLMREDSYTNTKKICEEMADVEICMEQLQRFFDSERELIDFIKEYKLKRLDKFYLNDRPNTTFAPGE